MNKKKRDCFATLVMTGRGKRSFAFTLSEVLIVLAVLGGVAAMTIPDLIQDAKEKALITALKKSYTEFSQAVDMAIAENGSVTGWDIGVGSSWSGRIKFYDILKPYLRISENCGTKTGCFAEHYEALFNTGDFSWQPPSVAPYAGVLASGISFYAYSRGTGCPQGYCGEINVDVNGKAGPNKAGVDYFSFQLTAEGVLIPMGKDVANSYGCTYNSSSIDNGFGCTWWALEHENMDYLRKAGVYINRQ